MAKLFANSEDPDQMPHSAASDLGLHCLPITLLRVSQLQWVKRQLLNEVPWILELRDGIHSIDFLPFFMTSFSLRKKMAKNSCSIDNLTRCFMVTVITSLYTSLFTRGGITRFTWGTTCL